MFKPNLAYLGVYRSKTRQFAQCRSTALRTRRVPDFDGSWSQEPQSAISSDEIALVEAGGQPGDIALKQVLPPEWLDVVEEVRFTISRIQQRQKELYTMHDKHLNRPTLDDGAEEEHTIEILTQDITTMFQSAQRDIQSLQHRGRECQSQDEAKMCRNASISLAQDLQNMSNDFRQGQRTYLQRIRLREEKTFQFFDMGEESAHTALSNAAGKEEEDAYDMAFTQSQVAQLDEETAMIEKRSQEVSRIMQSIRDLGEIFRDLNSMVISQGTVLDRIDYNLELVNVQVADGLSQLHKGERYQKKSRAKLLCILVLSLLILVFIILLALK